MKTDQDPKQNTPDIRVPFIMKKTTMSGLVSAIQPRTLIFITAILLFLFLGFAILEYWQTRSDVFALMEDEGFLLLDALSASGERAVLGYEELERQIIKCLVGQCRMIVELDERLSVVQDDLDRLSGELGLARIHIFGPDGKRRHSNRVDPTEIGFKENPEQYRDMLTPVLSGNQDSVILGTHQTIQTSEFRFSVAVKRPSGGAVLVSMAADQLVELRRQIGPGRLVQEIGKQAGIAYVALQDTTSIILASRQIHSLSRVQSDPFLYRIWLSARRHVRVIRFEDRDILEICGPFFITGDLAGLFRIGLELDRYDRVINNARLRLSLIALILIPVGLIGFSLLVTRQNSHLLDLAFKRFKTQSSEILENLEDAVVAVNAVGAITVFNRAAESLFHYPSDRAIGLSVDDLNLCCLSIIGDTIKAGKGIIRPEVNCVFEGDEVTLGMHTSILYAGNSRDVETVILVVTDLTAQKRLEFQLRQQEKFQAMGQLASGVAHEIRNPLNAIGMIVQRLAKEFQPVEDKAEYRDLIETVGQEVRRSNRIIQQFLRFARPQQLARSRIPGQELLEAVQSIFASSARMNHIQFESFAEDDVSLNIDVDQMKQALLNLLQNALDSCSRGDTIRLTGRKQDTNYLISVEDDGSGMSEEDQRHVFDLYFSTKKDGTGMGLPIVYQIVQNHGGKMDFTSQADQGSVFRIYLPLPSETETV